MTSEVRVLVVGGGFGRQHLEWLARCDRVSVNFLAYQKNEQRARELATEYGIGATTSAPADVIRSGAVDAVAVVSPPDTHEDYVRLSLDSGLLTVVDKPLCHSMDAASRLAAHPRSATAAVIFQWRLHPGFRKFREYLREGVLGRLQWIDLEFHHDFLAGSGTQFPWRHDAVRAGAGTLSDQGVHLFDALHELVPGRWEVTTARGAVAQARRVGPEGVLVGGTEDIAETWLDDVDGVAHARVFVSRVSAGLRRLRLLAHGDRGTAELTADPVNGAAALILRPLQRDITVIEFDAQEMNPYPAILEWYRDNRARDFDEVASISSGLRAQRLMSDAVARIDGQ